MMTTSETPEPASSRTGRFRFPCVGCGMTLPIRICSPDEEGRLIACAYCAEHYCAAIDPDADDEMLAAVVDRGDRVRR